MENNGAFNYQYSAANNREIENIRKKYLPQEESKMDRLKKLDNQVQTAGMIQGFTLGIVGCLIFGIGVCFCLGVFTATPWLTAALLVLGTLIMLPAYPVYRRIARRTKERLVPEILKLSDEIMKN